MKASSPPKGLDVDGNNHKLFKDLIEDRISPFYGKLMKDVFIAAMCIGFYGEARKELKNRKAGTIPRDTIEKDDEAIWLLKSVSIAEKGLDVLFDDSQKEIYSIAEEYANGGIKSLWSKVFEDKPGDIDKRMEEEIKEVIEKGELVK